MNRQNRFSCTPWIAVALLVLASAAFAQPGAGAGADPGPGIPGHGPMMMHARHGGPGGPSAHMRGRGMGGGIVEHLLAAGDEINLTDAQRDKLHQIRRGSPAALMPKRQAVVEAQMDLHDALATDKTDAAALRRAHDKVLKARTELATAMFDLRVQVREVLTVEQRQKIHDHMRGAGREQMRERRKNRGPGGPGSGFFEGDDDESDEDVSNDGGDF